MDLLNKDVTNLSFEEAFERLNKVVELIEGGDVSLDESIKYYEIGILLKNHCEEKLKNAEIKIKKVVDNKLNNIDGDKKNTGQNGQNKRIKFSKKRKRHSSNYSTSTKSMIRARPFSNTRGHTAFLTFAIKIPLR